MFHLFFWRNWEFHIFFRDLLTYSLTSLNFVRFQSISLKDFSFLFYIETFGPWKWLLYDLIEKKILPEFIVQTLFFLNFERFLKKLYLSTVSKSASGAVTSELILDKVTWSDEGIYSCLAKEVGSKDDPTKQDIILDIYGEYNKFCLFYTLSLIYDSKVSSCYRLKQGFLRSPWLKWEQIFLNLPVSQNFS